MSGDQAPFDFGIDNRKCSNSGNFQADEQATLEHVQQPIAFWWYNKRDKGQNSDAVGISYNGASNGYMHNSNILKRTIAIPTNKMPFHNDPFWQQILECSEFIPFYLH